MKKINITTIIISLIIGVGVALVAVNFFQMQKPVDVKRMPHGPTGFDTNAGMDMGMGTDRQLTSDVFDLDVNISPEKPKVDEEMKISAKITSKTAPHARTVVSFLVDGEKLEELQGVIPPFQSEVAEFTWQTEAGMHKLELVLASAVGIEFARWERTIDIASS